MHFHIDHLIIKSRVQYVITDLRKLCEDKHLNQLNYGSNSIYNNKKSLRNQLMFLKMFLFMFLFFLQNKIYHSKGKMFHNIKYNSWDMTSFLMGSFVIAMRSLTAISSRDSRSETWEWFVSVLVMLGCFSSSLLLLAIKAHAAALVSSSDKVGRGNVFLVALQFSLAFFLLLPRPIFFSFFLCYRTGSK